jgi:thiamine-phosphate pyrophosphorylase
VPFIVNDYPDIALAADADGVHLGQGDMSVQEARALLGEDKIIGVSTHCIEHALKAERDGADYIGVGPVFPTTTKPDKAAVTTAYVSEASKLVTIPFVAIGGITPHNAGSVIAAGARRICAVSAIVGSADPAGACREMLRLLDEGDRAAAGADRHMASEAQRAFSIDRASVTITLNGNRYDTTATNLESLLTELGQRDKRLVAELGGEIVPRIRWQDTALADGQRIELIQFVGGG